MKYKLQLLVVGEYTRINLFYHSLNLQKRIHRPSLKITENYEWVYVIVNEHKGWVPADALGVDRGGPTLDTPEESIYWDLIGGNLI